MNDVCTGRFELDDASYLLGTLGREERRRFEAHLPGCAACRARVAELSGTALLLAGLDATDVAAVAARQEPVPDTALTVVLHRAQSARRRRAVALAGLAAAVLAVLMVTHWPASSVPPPGGHRMVAVAATPLTATATLATESGGTRISLVCHYASGSGYPGTGGTYLLTVVDTSGATHDLGSWSIRPGADTRLSGGVALPRSAIREVRVTTPERHPVLSLML